MKTKGNYSSGSDMGAVTGYIFMFSVALFIFSMILKSCDTGTGYQSLDAKVEAIQAKDAHNKFLEGRKAWTDSMLTANGYIVD